MGLWADIKGITGLGGTAGFLKVSTAGAISVDPGGSGDVVGPAGATAGHLAVFADATGKILKDGGAPSSGGAKRWRLIAGM